MRGKTLLIILLLVATAGAVAFMLRQLDQTPPPTQDSAALTKAPPPGAPPPRASRHEAPAPLRIDALPPTEVAGALEIPLPRVSGLAYVRLDASIVEAPAPVLRVTGQSANLDVWEALLRLALEVGRRADTVQVRVDLDVRDLPPRLEYVLPLALGLRLRLTDQPWPGKIMVAGFPAPDGGILPVADTAYVQELAGRAGWVLDQAQDVQSLFASWAPTGTDRWTGCSGESAERIVGGANRGARDAALTPLVPDEGIVARNVAEVVGALAAGAEVPSRPNESPERRLRMLEGTLLAARLTTPGELLQQAWMAAELRANGRMAALVSERLPQIGRLAAKTPRGRRPHTARPGPLEPQMSAWVTALVRAEDLTRTTFTVVGREAGRLVPGPRPFASEHGALINSRARTLTALSDALATVVAWRVAPPRRLPHPYPWTSVALLDAARPLPPATRNLVADYGGALRRVATLWAATAVLAAWNPQVEGRGAGLVIKDPADLLERMRRSLERSDRCAVAMARHADVPVEAARLVATAALYRRGDAAGTDVSAALSAVEAAWQASMLIDELSVFAARAK